MRIKSFFISVEPRGSKFAKALQTALRNKVVNKVFRVDHAKAQQIAQRNVRLGNQPRHNLFFVTTQPKDKIEQFRAFSQNNVACPQFATTVEAAKTIECRTLFARTLVNSTNGRGIVEFEASAEQYPHAPLYTEYIPKKAEYRLHVFGGVVIDRQQKKKRSGVAEEDRNTRVRNMANGYVYTRDGIVPPAGIDDLAVAAVGALGYQYGAVDIIYNEKRNACYVLEVNSRPGLMGTTVERYADALISMYGLQRK